MKTGTDVDRTFRKNPLGKLFTAFRTKLISRLPCLQAANGLVERSIEKLEGLLLASLENYILDESVNREHNWNLDFRQTQQKNQHRSKWKLEQVGGHYRRVHSICNRLHHQIWIITVFRKIGQDLSTS